LVTTDVPGHHRPIITKQLKCQIAALREVRRASQSVRRRAGDVFGATKARISLPSAVPDSFAQARFHSSSAACFGVSIKAAPIDRNILSGNGMSSATSAMAQGLATQRLLHRMQKRKCSQNAHEMILF
jgi:hypothetical protein